MTNLELIKVSKLCAWRLKNIVANMRYASEVKYPSPYFILVRFGEIIYSIPRSAVKQHQGKELTEQEKRIRRK